jgi:AraC-like DNA-binding protein
MTADRKCIPPFMFNLVVRVLDERKLGSAALVMGADLTLEELTHQDTRISFRDALTLIENAYRISGDEALGLNIANEVNIADWGMMGYAVASCASLGESLRIGQRYNRVATRLTDNRLEVGEQECSFDSAPLYNAGELERFLVEEDLGGVVGMLHRYLGDSANPREVHFSYAEPGYIEDYRRHFRCPLKFGQERNKIIWNSQDMERPFPQRNPAATAMAIEHCEKLISDERDRGTVTDRVRSYMVQEPGHYPPIEEVSAAFNMSESSLRRALKAESSSYQRILNDVRMKLAVEYLTTSSLKLEAIAQLVGYSDLSNFRRAFRGWTGKSPMAYRKGRGAG